MNILKIRCHDYTAEINLSRGANCISLNNKKYNACILREPNYSAVLDNPYLYGMPILFPVNRIEKGEFEFEGRRYVFPVNEKETNCHIHGFSHQAEFKLIEKSENSVRCKYDSDELYEFFPHEFSVEVSYFLDEDGLTQETCVHNRSGTNMPVFLGFHTTFNVPFISDSRAQNVCVFAQIGDEIERNMRNYLPTGRILSGDEIHRQLNSGDFYPANNKISRHYKAGKTGKIELSDIEKHLKIVYDNDSKFGWRLFYNKCGEGFMCLEPQTCMVNCQNMNLDRKNTGFDYIAPNASKKYVSRIYLEEF